MTTTRMPKPPPLALSTVEEKQLLLAPSLRVSPAVLWGNPFLLLASMSSSYWFLQKIRVKRIQPSEEVTLPRTRLPGSMRRSQREAPQSPRPLAFFIAENEFRVQTGHKASNFRVNLCFFFSPAAWWHHPLWAARRLFWGKKGIPIVPCSDLSVCMLPISTCRHVWPFSFDVTLVDASYDFGTDPPQRAEHAHCNLTPRWHRGWASSGTMSPE